jgi:hypothetical protein
MTKRHFAPVTVLTDETTVLGAAVAQWDELLTTGFVEALPKKPVSNEPLSKKSATNQATGSVVQLATA